MHALISGDEHNHKNKALQIIMNIYKSINTILYFQTIRKFRKEAPNIK